MGIWSGNMTIGYVSEEDGDEPVLTLTNGDNPSLTFVEIEHIMDNWNNLPKN